MRYFLITTVVVLVLIAIISISWNMTAYRDVDLLKETAPKFISERGYTITSFDGYTGGYGQGGAVWYQARDEKGYLYSMSVTEWRGELQLYELTCLNAVANK